jgi:hypothetical protein
MASANVPSEQLLNLTSLNYVDFWNNHLTGTVIYTGWSWDTDWAHQIGLGTVPTELGALSDLSSLAFGGNQLTGTLPADLGALAGLTYLYFSGNGALTGNQLTGTVPALPFKQYTANCCLSPNNLSCPLPADAAACICNGKPGVVCH